MEVNKDKIIQQLLNKIAELSFENAVLKASIEEAAKVEESKPKEDE